VPKDRLLEELHVKFKYICIEQKQNYLHSVVIIKIGSKSEL